MQSQGDLYQKLVWGGVFGFLFLIPLRKYVKQWWLRASIFGKNCYDRYWPLVTLMVQPMHHNHFHA